jgi:glutamine synthetase
VKLPRTLLEAIEAFAEDELVHETFPKEFVSAYVDMKVAEWDDYHRQVGEWERSKYLLAF